MRFPPRRSRQSAPYGIRKNPPKAAGCNTLNLILVTVSPVPAGAEPTSPMMPHT